MACCSSFSRLLLAATEESAADPTREDSAAILLRIDASSACMRCICGWADPMVAAPSWTLASSFAMSARMLLTSGFSTTETEFSPPRCPAALHGHQLLRQFSQARDFEVAALVGGQDARLSAGRRTAWLWAFSSLSLAVLTCSSKNPAYFLAGSVRSSRPISR